MTLFSLKNMSIQCIQAGADVGLAFSDDLYMTVNGKRFSFFNLSEGAPSDEGGGFLPGQFGSALTGNESALFNDSAIINFFDQDDPFIDGFTGIFEGGDDFITSALLQPPLQDQFHFSFNIQGEGSSYHIETDVFRSTSGPVLKPRHPSGKVAEQTGGVMQGSNTAGTLVGRNGKDIIYANNGNDIVLGGNNDDVLNGGKGNDISFGGKGKDILSGGAGKDVFVIAPKTGLDTVKDFREGEDVIGLGGGLAFQNLRFIQQKSGIVIRAGHEKLMFLQGVSAHPLTPIDFTQVNLTDLNHSAKMLLASVH